MNVLQKIFGHKKMLFLSTICGSFVEPVQHVRELGSIAEKITITKTNVCLAYFPYHFFVNRYKRYIFNEKKLVTEKESQKVFFLAGNTTSVVCGSTKAVQIIFRQISRLYIDTFESRPLHQY